MSHAFAQQVKISNPGADVTDADNTTPLPGTPIVVDSKADLWQLNVEQQVLDGDTVVADWAGSFLPGAPIGRRSQVTDVATGALYQVHGQPQALSSLRTGLPDHIEARLKFISDEQGAST